MRGALGPLWALALILDRNLVIVVLLANVVFAFLFARLFFKGRPKLDSALITLALFVILTTVSLVGMHWFAATPVRELSFFAVD